MQSLLPYLQQRQDEMVQTLRTLVEYESPSRDKAANDGLGAVLADLAATLFGGEVEVIPNPDLGNHLRIEWNSSGDASQILLLGHMDTVWAKGTLETLPFRIEEGKVHGPGSFDMKGGLVQGLYALSALRELNRLPKCKIVFLITSDEEIGSRTSRELIEAEAARSRCVFVLEPSAGPRGALKTSRKGVGGLTISVEGVSAHAGLDPQKGRSAITELAHQILYLHSLTNYESGTTLNVGVISGGTVSNVVAAHASARLDLRVSTQAEAEKIMPQVLNLQPMTDGTRVTVTGEINRPPLERTEQVAALYEIARRIAREELDIDLPEAAVGGASDGNFTGPIAPTLDGLGPVGDGAHANHEHLIIEEMPRRSALLARLIEEVGK